MSKAKTKFVYVTFIASTPEKIFDSITNPEIARQYWGHENVSDWKPDSKWEHVRSDSKREIKIAGKVVMVDRAKRLIISWASPENFSDDEKHSRVTFDLVPYNDMVKLTVTHDELEEDSGMATGISKGWPIVLSSLKSFLENGLALDVFAQPKTA